jgi:hypothetical protein
VQGLRLRLVGVGASLLLSVGVIHRHGQRRCAVCALAARTRDHCCADDHEREACTSGSQNQARRPASLLHIGFDDQGMRRPAKEPG